MQDPYKVLGIERGASDADIKKAYRSLSRKYHPDANMVNPNKDKAEAQFKEVQQAYEQIMKEKEYGSSYNGGYGGNFGGFGGGFNGQQRAGQSGDDVYMNSAASYMQNRMFREALNVLKNVEERNARWYYYSAYANAAVGNNVIALEHAREACRREPDNVDYSMFLQRLEGGGSWYQNMQSPYESTGLGGNGMCFRLILANIICNLCCGGGGLCFGGRGMY